MNPLHPFGASETRPSAALRCALTMTIASLMLATGWAEIRNVGFQGELTQVSDSRFLLDPSVTNGAPFEGYYIYNTEAVDSNSDATVGDYYFTNSACGIVVKIGNYVFRSNPHHVNFLIELVNRTNDDHYLLRSYLNVCSRPLMVDHISWQLDDFEGSALSDAVLPAAPPDLSAFHQDFGLTVVGGSGFESTYLIRGKVTSVTENQTVIPENPAVDIREAVEIRWPSLLGYFYQIQGSGNLTNWNNLGPQIMGDGTTQSFVVPKDTNSFFRAEIINFLR